MSDDIQAVIARVLALKDDAGMCFCDTHAANYADDALTLATALQDALKREEALADYWFGPKIAPLGWWEVLCCKAMARREDEPIWHEEGCVEYPMWMSWRARHETPGDEA